MTKIDRNTNLKYWKNIWRGKIVEIHKTTQ